MDATYTAELPTDYYHLLNCLCLFQVNNTNKCYDVNTVARFSATRLTADTWSQVVDNYWLRPSYKRPYYYIHNVNTNTEVPTNPVHDYSEIENAGTDKVSEEIELNPLVGYEQAMPLASEQYLNKFFVEVPIQVGHNETLYKCVYDRLNDQYDWMNVSAGMINEYFSFLDNTYIWDGTKMTQTTIPSANVKTKTEEEYQYVEGQKDPFKTIDISGFISTDTNAYPQRNSQIRYGNASKPLIEIRYGEDTSTFELKKIMVDYIKAPQHIRLTQEQIDRTLDFSQVLEFPDYVCQEIVNELVHIIMENIGDPKLQTHPVVSQSIANPAQQQTTPQE